MRLNGIEGRAATRGHAFGDAPIPGVGESPPGLLPRTSERTAIFHLICVNRDAHERVPGRVPNAPRRSAAEGERRIAPPRADAL